MIPAAIIVVGILVAGAIIFSGGNGNNNQVATNTDSQNAQQQAPPQEPEGSLDDIRPVTAEDHIKGSIDAPVKIIEYSDFECPFCKRFHVTMNQVIDEYGDSGQVAWVYRQFPLD